MTLAADINDLLASAAVTALVGDRIYPSLARQGTAKPYVVWRRQGGDPLATLNDGASRGRQIIVVLMAAYAESFDEADAISEALRGAVLAGSTAMKGKSVNPPIDGFDPETRLFSVVLEARLFHRS